MLGSSEVSLLLFTLTNCFYFFLKGQYGVIWWKECRFYSPRGTLMIHLPDIIFRHFIYFPGWHFDFQLCLSQALWSWISHLIVLIFTCKNKNRVKANEIMGLQSTWLTVNCVMDDWLQKLNGIYHYK